MRGGVAEQQRSPVRRRGTHVAARDRAIGAGAIVDAHANVSSGGKCPGKQIGYGMVRAAHPVGTTISSVLDCAVDDAITRASPAREFSACGKT